ncbi:MAG: periplasmic heavy metal sensor [Candidatus Eremiobacteraeota bacterium]|nr:periplasmic heavy metal sensor [Candidatus Eremiobacteraeota bacterium]
MANRGFRRLLSLALFAAWVALMLSCGAAAQEEKASPQETKAPEGKFTRMVERDGALNLTSEQKAELKKIRARFEDKQEDLDLSMKAKKIEMVKLFREESPDRKKIETRLKELNALEGSRQKLFLDEFFEVREILTPEQVKLFTRKTVRALLRP